MMRRAPTISCVAYLDTSFQYASHPICLVPRVPRLTPSPVSGRVSGTFMVQETHASSGPASNWQCRRSPPVGLRLRAAQSRKAVDWGYRTGAAWSSPCHAAIAKLSAVEVPITNLLFRTARIATHAGPLSVCCVTVFFHYAMMRCELASV